MWWMAIAKAGMAVAKAVAGNRVAKAQEALGAAKAKYENAIRAEGNKLQGAETALANVAQSIGNRRKLDAAGANLARAGEALARQQEAATANRFSRRVQAAEQAGAAVAGAAFAGVTGGNVNTLIETATLRGEMVEEVADRQQDQNEYELRKNAAEQVASGIEGLDSRIIRPNLDVGVSINQAPKAGSLLEALTHPEMVNDLTNAANAAYNQFAKPKGYAGGDTNNSFFGGNRGSGD